MYLRGEEEVDTHQQKEKKKKTKKKEKEKNKKKNDAEVFDVGAAKIYVEDTFTDRRRNRKKTKQKNLGENDGGFDGECKKKGDGRDNILEKKNEKKKETKVSNANLSSSVKRKRKREEETKWVAELENLDHIERKKGKSIKDVGEKLVVDRRDLVSEISDQTVVDFKISGHGKPKKRVKFSSIVEVFPLSNGLDVKEGNQEKKRRPCNRYSQEEDEMIKDAVFNFIEMRGLGEKGVEMVMNVRSHPQIRNCWKDICLGLPWRSCESVRHRAYILFNKYESRKQTSKEKESIKKFDQENGSQLKTHKKEHHSAVVVKSTCNKIKPLNTKKGHWSREEYQTLYDLVNTNLRMLAFEERKSNNLQLQDDIFWEAISTKMGTRTPKDCYRKWYRKLAPPLVKNGEWAPLDDYRLVDALFMLDACCMEDINWDDLVLDRPGDVCRIRFKQMCNMLSQDGFRCFLEQVDMLANHYGVDVLEIKENANGSNS